jgi:hypothetical protein
MLRIDVTSVKPGDWLVLRSDNGNIVAGVLRGHHDRTLRLKVWLDAFERIQITDADLSDTQAGEERDYTVDSTVRLYRSSELEITPLLSPVNDLDDLYNYLDGLIVLENTGG